MADVKWTKEQLDAINVRDSKVLVAAGAGSGKTAVLVERIINKITSMVLVIILTIFFSTPILSLLFLSLVLI